MTDTIREELIYWLRERSMWDGMIKLIDAANMLKADAERIAGYKEDQRELMSQMCDMQEDINELKAKQVHMLEANAREIEAEEKLAQQVAVPAGWYQLDAQLAAILGEIDMIQRTELKSQTEQQKERVRDLRAECVALHYQLFPMLKAAPQGDKP